MAKRYVSEHQKKRKKKRRKGSNRLYYIFLALIAVVVLVVLSLTVLFPIKEITVEGKSRYSAAQIESASEIALDANLFSSDLKDVEDHITSALPYIESVQVQRKLPGTVLLTVKEATVYAQIQNGSDYVLINAAGKCLEILNAPMEGVPVVRGLKVGDVNPGALVTTDENTNQLELLQLLTDAFEKAELSDITVINVADENDLWATYDDRIVMQFGSRAELDEKMAHGIAVLEVRNNDSETGKLNLSRIPNGKKQASFIQCSLEADETVKGG